MITPGCRHQRGRRGRHRDGDAPGQAVRPADHPGPRRPVGDPRHRLGRRPRRRDPGCRRLRPDRATRRRPRRRAGHAGAGLRPGQRTTRRCAVRGPGGSVQPQRCDHPAPAAAGVHPPPGRHRTARARQTRCDPGELRTRRADRHRRRVRGVAGRPARRGRAGRLRTRTPQPPPAVRPPRRRAHPASDGVEPAGHRRHLHRRRPGSPRRPDRDPTGRGREPRLGERRTAPLGSS